MPGRPHRSSSQPDGCAGRSLDIPGTGPHLLSRDTEERDKKTESLRAHLVKITLFLFFGYFCEEQVSLPVQINPTNIFLRDDL